MKKTQGKSVVITLKKSGIGCPQDQRQTLVGLGLRKLNSVSVLKDSPSVRGMIYKVCHLVSVKNA